MPMWVYNGYRLPEPLSWASNADTSCPLLLHHNTLPPALPGLAFGMYHAPYFAVMEL